MTNKLFDAFNSFSLPYHVFKNKFNGQYSVVKYCEGKANIIFTSNYWPFIQEEPIW